MKKSEFFKKIYTDIQEVNEFVGETYYTDNILPEMLDEQKDLGISENCAKFIETAFYCYSKRLTLELAASLTEILAEYIKLEPDTNLFDPKVASKLLSETSEN